MNDPSRPLPPPPPPPPPPTRNTHLSALLLLMPLKMKPTLGLGWVLFVRPLHNHIGCIGFLCDASSGSADVKQGAGSGQYLFGINLQSDDLAD